MFAFNRDLGDAMKAHQGTPLDYGSELRDPVGIAKLFSHHEDNEIIMDIIQKGSQYLLSPINEAFRRSDLDTMIIRVNNKPTKSKFNKAGLDKSRG